jgi:hypothetical protein
MKRDKRKGKRQPSHLATINRHAAGIDMGAQEHWGAVPADSDLQPVRRFWCMHGGSSSPGRLAAAVRGHYGSDGIDRRVRDSAL